jgi:hypothetical protein
VEFSIMADLTLEKVLDVVAKPLNPSRADVVARKYLH